MAPRPLISGGVECMTIAQIATIQRLPLVHISVVDEFFWTSISLETLQVYARQLTGLKPRTKLNAKRLISIRSPSFNHLLVCPFVTAKQLAEYINRNGSRPAWVEECIPDPSKYHLAIIVLLKQSGLPLKTLVPVVNSGRIGPFLTSLGTSQLTTSGVIHPLDGHAEELDKDHWESYCPTIYSLWSDACWRFTYFQSQAAFEQAQQWNLFLQIGHQHANQHERQLFLQNSNLVWNGPNCPTLRRSGASGGQRRSILFPPLEQQSEDQVQDEPQQDDHPQKEEETHTQEQQPQGVDQATREAQVERTLQELLRLQRPREGWFLHSREQPRSRSCPTGPSENFQSGQSRSHTLNRLEAQQHDQGHHRQLTLWQPQLENCEQTAQVSDSMETQSKPSSSDPAFNLHMQEQDSQSTHSGNIRPPQLGELTVPQDLTIFRVQQASLTDQHGQATTMQQTGLSKTPGMDMSQEEVQLAAGAAFSSQ